MTVLDQENFEVGIPNIARIPARTTVTAPAPGGAQAALEHLATALDPREFAAVLVTGAGRRPCLTISSRLDKLVEDVYADQRSYWWSWAEPICATSDPLAAAWQVAAALRGIAPAEGQE